MAGEQDIRIYYYLGVCHLVQHRLDEAYYLFKRALEAYPDFADAQYALDVFQGEKKEYAKALGYFEKALSLYLARKNGIPMHWIRRIKWGINAGSIF